MLVEACRGKEFVKMWTVNGYIVWWPWVAGGLPRWRNFLRHFAPPQPSLTTVWGNMEKKLPEKLDLFEVMFYFKNHCKSLFESFFWLHNVKSLNFSRFSSPKCCLCSQPYLLKPTVRPWKSMVGRWKFPLGCPIFRGYVSSGSVNGSSELLHFFDFFVWLHKMHKVLKNGRVQEWRWNIYDGKCGGFKRVLLFSSLFTKMMTPFWQSIVLHQLGWEFPNF